MIFQVNVGEGMARIEDPGNAATGEYPGHTAMEYE
jgi:hypothetical protein